MKVGSTYPIGIGMSMGKVYWVWYGFGFGFGMVRCIGMDIDLT